MTFKDFLFATFGFMTIGFFAGIGYGVFNRGLDYAKACVVRWWNGQ